MRRLFLLFLVCCIGFGMQFLANCSSPLEPDDGPDPNPPRFDTIYLTDTLIDIDTVFIPDSNALPRE